MQIEDIILITMYATNIGSPKYIKQILTDLKRETENNHLQFWKIVQTEIQ